jgi:hypothetical protein
MIQITIAILQKKKITDSFYELHPHWKAVSNATAHKVSQMPVVVCTTA